MSKVWNSFKAYVLEKNHYGKLFNNHNPGQRIIPAQVAKKDEENQLRIDAGEVKDGKKNIYLQANSQAKNSAIKKYISKHGTHSNIATTQIDVNVPEEKQKDEVERALEDLQRGYKSKIG